MERWENERENGGEEEIIKRGENQNRRDGELRGNVKKGEMRRKKVELRNKSFGTDKQTTSPQFRTFQR